jgi:hypothetical protein
MFVINMRANFIVSILLDQGKPKWSIVCFRQDFYLQGEIDARW